MNTATLLLLFSTMTQHFDLPKGLLSALCFVESSHDIKAIHIDDGEHNSVGVCQVQLPTAKTMGFKGTEVQLQNPKTNIFYAAKYLHMQLNRYDGDIVKAISAYNSGTYRLTRNGKLINQHYVDKVFNAWEERT